MQRIWTPDPAWQGTRLLARVAAFLCAYAALAVIAWAIADAPDSVFPLWWPPGGLAYGMLLVAPQRSWPPILIGLAVLLAAMEGAQLQVEPAWPPLPLGVWLAQNLLAPLLAASALRWRHPEPLSLHRLTDTLRVIVCAIVVGGAVTIALIGLAIWLWPEPRPPFAPLAVWSGRVVGSLVGAPLVLTLREHAPIHRRGATLELLAVGIGLFVALWAAFDFPFVESRMLRFVAERGGRIALAATLFLLLGWAALRAGPRGAAWTSFFATLLATWWTGLGYGPFGIPGVDPLYLRFAYVEVFFGFAAMAALVTAALGSSRQRDRRRQRLSLRLGYEAGREVPLDERLAAILRATSATLGAPCELELGERRLRHPPDAPPLREAPRPGAEVVVLPVREGARLLLQAPNAFPTLDDNQIGAARVVAEGIRDVLAREDLHRDVEARARQNEESLALLDAVVGGSPLGISIHDRDVRFVRVNEPLAALNDLSAEAHLGRTPSELFGESGAELEKVLRQVIASGEPIVDRRFGVPAAALPGGIRWLACTWFPVRVRGEVIGASTVVADITSPVAAEAERASLFAEAQEAIRVRDEFLSLASHELKSPLTPLAVRLQRLRRAVAEHEPIDPGTIDKALRSLDRLKLLIDELLDVENMGARPMRLHRQCVDWAEIIRGTSDVYRRRSPTHRLQVHLPFEPVTVDADGPRLRQVVDNLLDNAFKFSPAGGNVRVTLERHDGRADLRIEDEGIGIPAEDRERIFERFGRGSNAPALAYGGLGLGLFLSRTIIEGLGGTITVESSPSEGSIFTVSLPVALRAADEQHA